MRILFSYCLIFLFSLSFLFVYSPHSSGSPYITEKHFLLQTTSSSSGSICSCINSNNYQCSSGCTPSCSTPDFTLDCVFGELQCCTSSGTNCTSGSLICVSSSSGGFSNNSTSGGTQVLDTYIFTNGTLIGLQLYTEPSSTFVGSTLNPFTSASGIIVPAKESFNGSSCKSQSFHGDLFGKKDPNPKTCGWGKLEKATSLSKNIQDISLAIHSGVITLENIKQEESDFNKAISDISSSITALDNLNISISLDTKIKNKSKLKSNINCAKQKDTVAKDIIENLQADPERKDKPLLNKVLKDGLRCKRRIITSFLRKEEK